MECTFDQRKLELEAECVVRPRFFESCLDRLKDFMKPLVQSMNRFDQRGHTETIVTGLCSDLKGKNAESIAYHFNLNRKTMQYFIGQSLLIFFPAFLRQI